MHADPRILSARTCVHLRPNLRFVLYDLLRLYAGLVDMKCLR